MRNGVDEALAKAEAAGYRVDAMHGLDSVAGQVETAGEVEAAERKIESSEAKAETIEPEEPAAQAKAEPSSR
jgi:hypothetical protein